jgi:hypothetical protein
MFGLSQFRRNCAAQNTVLASEAAPAQSDRILLSSFRTATMKRSSAAVFSMRREARAGGASRVHDPWRWFAFDANRRNDASLQTRDFQSLAGCGGVKR